MPICKGQNSQKDKNFKKENPKEYCPQEIHLKLKKVKSKVLKIICNCKIQKEFSFEFAFGWAWRG